MPRSLPLSALDFFLFRRRIHLVIFCKTVKIEREKSETNLSELLDPSGEPALVAALPLLLLFRCCFRFCFCASALVSSFFSSLFFFFSSLFIFFFFFSFFFFAAALVVVVAAAAASLCRRGNCRGESGSVNEPTPSVAFPCPPRHRRLGGPHRVLVLQVDHSAGHLHLDVRLPFLHGLDVKVRARGRGGERGVGRGELR